MAQVVVDTNVVSYLFKNDSRAVLYHPHLAGKLLVISFMTEAEIYRWGIVRNWGKRKLSWMKRHLQKFLVYASNAALSYTWAEVKSGMGRKGLAISTDDA